MHILVIGAGSWGYALASACNRINNIKVTLYGRKAINETTKEKYRYINYTTVLIECDILIIATPINSLSNVLQNIRANMSNIPDIIVASKGFNEQKHLSYQILEEYRFNNFVLLLGPSFATEVLDNKPTAICFSSKNIEYATKLAKIFTIPNIRIYTNDDIIGSSASAAVKNVIAIASGICDGFLLGYNAKAALITRSLSEICDLTIALGGNIQTVYGLCGIGDILLTCTSSLSRNYQVGAYLATGLSLKATLEKIGHVAEGVTTAVALYELSMKLMIDMPIAKTVYKILYETYDIKTAISDLLNRESRSE